jgi:hypothetical protein
MHSRSLDPWRHEHVFLGAAAYKKRLGRVAGLSHVTIEVEPCLPEERHRAA